jgi:hypothetical protein
MTNAARFAHRKTANGRLFPRPSALAVFIARADARALLCEACEFDLHEAIDPLQEAAERDGLVTVLGHDAVQEIISTAFGAVQ